MTASSPKSGRARFPTSLFAADTPIDAAFARNVAANNALHGADEQAHVFVNFQSFATGPFPTNTPSPLGIAGGTGSVWVPVRSFGPFPLSVREDGVPFKLRVRCAASMSSAGVSAEVAVTVGSAASLADLTYTTGENSVLFTPTITGTTPTVLAPITSNLITIGAGELESSYSPRPTLDDTAGSPIEIGVPEFVVRLWAKRKTGTRIRIHQLHVAEYVG